MYNHGSVSCFPQKKWHECVCPWSLGESRAICQVAIQLQGTQLFHAAHGAAIPAQTSSALCSLLSAFLQLTILPVYWKKLLSRSEPRSSRATFTCATYSQSSMHPTAISLGYGHAELSHPPSSNLSVSQLTGTLTVCGVCVPPGLCRHGGWVVLPRAGSLPPSQACSLLTKQQSTMCTESLLPAAG